MKLWMPAVVVVVCLGGLSQAMAQAGDVPGTPPPEGEVVSQDVGSPVDAEVLSLVALVEGFYKQIQCFSARFDQEVVRSHLPDRPIKKSGKVYFKRPGKMRWDYSRPEKIHYVSDGKFLWNYVPESQLVYKLPVEDSELFYALRFLYGEGNLARDFLVSSGGSEGDLKVLVLAPRESQQNFQELRLLVDPKDGHIEGTILKDPAGNVSRLYFRKVSTKALPDKGFEFTPPDGVEVLEPGK